MTVFLGDSGRILLRRKGSDQVMRTTVNTSDVRDDVNRFSVDFAHEQLISGDRLEIRSLGGENLTWIDHPDVDNSFTRYINVDAAGGIRLYDTFSDAVSDNRGAAVSLVKPPQAQQVTLKVADSGTDRCLAEVRNYSITTSRETIDTTNLGAHYRKQYESGLIQGQGQIVCLWRNENDGSCEDSDDYKGEVEFSSYLAKLCIRLVHGAAFHGQFYIYTSGEFDEKSVWYESDTCIVTNVAVTVTPAEVVETTIDFITSGPITLQEGYLSKYLQLEDGYYVLQEDAFGGRIELENPD